MGQSACERSVEIKCYICEDMCGRWGRLVKHDKKKRKSTYVIGRDIWLFSAVVQNIVAGSFTVPQQDVNRAWFIAALLNDARSVDVPQVALSPTAPLRSHRIRLQTRNLRRRLIRVRRCGVKALVVRVIYIFK